MKTKEGKELSLYSITSTLREIENGLIENHGEINEQTEELMVLLKKELTQKTDNVVSFIDSLNGQMELADKEILRILNFKEKVGKSLIKFENYVLDCMDQMNVVKLEGPMRKISIRKPLVSVDIYDEDKIPLNFIKTKTVKTTSIDKNEIKKLLKDNKEVDGAKLVTGKRKVEFK